MNNIASKEMASQLERIAQPVEMVERYMAKCLDDRAMPSHLRQAVRYALLGSGKRLRPTLVLRSCEAVGGSLESALTPAAAIEMIHCFSLVHDDLPAMDDDDLRRGRPTLHKHTNEAMAILAGDMMFGLAFELIAQHLRPAELASQVGLELARGANNMIAGQVYDTLPQFDDDTEPFEQLKTTHRHKTGALIICACRMGALCGGANAIQLKSITSYAEAIGLMFQVVDDLLDVTQTTENLGKAANKDAGKGRLTYPGVLGLEATRREVVQLQDQAHRALTPLGDHARCLRDLCDFMAVREK